jgi:hypothetical protein
MPLDARRTREPPARLSGECPPDRFHSSRDSAPVFRCKGTNLHSTDRSGRAARCPIKRPVKRGEFQDCESPQLLLGIREGAILYVPLSFLKPHRGPSLRSLKWIAADKDAGFDERLVVRPPGAELGIGFVVIPCRKSFW